MKTSKFLFVLLSMLALFSVFVIFFSGNGGTAKKADPTLYPEKVIQVIVPNGAGGGTDRVSRLVVQELNKKFPVGVAVVNIPGGGTSKGAQKATRARPDGYTLLSTHEALLTSSAMKINRLGPEKLQPIAQIGTETFIIAVSPESPMKTLADFYEAANNGIDGRRLKLGVNPGAANHFFMIKALMPTKTDVVFIPSGGGAKTLKQILGGHLDASIFNVSEVTQLIEAGKLQGIATFDKTRHRNVPSVPTAIEQGHDIIIPLNFVMHAPLETDPAIVEKLAKTIKEIVEDKEFCELLLSQSITPQFHSGKALKEKIARTYEEMKTIAAYIKESSQKQGNDE